MGHVNESCVPTWIIIRVVYVLILVPINCGYYCPCVTSKASGSKDSRVIIWNVRTGHSEVTLSGHTDSVESVLWGGEGLLYSGSRDCKIKVCCILLSPIFSYHD